MIDRLLNRSRPEVKCPIGQYDLVTSAEQTQSSYVIRINHHSRNFEIRGRKLKDAVINAHTVVKAECHRLGCYSEGCLKSDAESE